MTTEQTVRVMDIQERFTAQADRVARAQAATLQRHDRRGTAAFRGRSFEILALDARSGRWTIVDGNFLQTEEAQVAC